MSDNIPKIIYVGSDIGYWNTLKNKFGELYSSLAFNCLSTYRDRPSELQGLICEIRNDKPKIVFVDFSQNTAEMLHIVRVLSRLNRVNKPVIIGLVDLNQGIVPSQRAILAGATCVHIKSVELSSVVYNAMSFAYPENLSPHGFATAQLNDAVLGRIPCMVSILSQDGIRIESNLPLSIGEDYPLHTRWSDKGILKTPLAECVSSTTEDLYYNYCFAQEFGFQLVPNDSIEGNIDEEQSEEAIEKYDQEREEVLLLLEQWIIKNKEFSHPKALKTLVIDKELSFYNGTQNTDEFPFVLRCQPYLKDVESDLRRILAQLIIFNYEEVTTEELESNEDIAFSFNEIRTLKHLIKSIKQVSGYEPYIIVFNSTEYDTVKIKTVLNYENIISYSDPMTTELVLKMSNMLKDKLMENVIEYDDDTLFLKKDHPATYAELEVDMTILAVSENDIYFNSPLDLPLRTVLRLTTPVNMYISITEPPSQSQVKSQYYGVIHTIGELERSNLRMFINSVFFRKHEEKKAEERENVQALKKQALDKKILEEQKQKEAEELERQKEEAAEKELEAQKEKDKIFKEDES